MTANKTLTLQEYAMRFGTLMGIFWILKFILIPLGFTIPLIQLLFILLTLFVPILGYLYARRFRNRYNGGTITFGRAYIFTFFLYIFASILTAAAHYIYFRFIDQGFLFDSYRKQIEEVRQSVQGDMAAILDQSMETLNLIASFTPSEMTLNLLSNNIFYGMLLALPTALLVMKRKKTNI